MAVIHRFVPEVSYKTIGDYRVKLEIDGFNIGIRKETYYGKDTKFVKLVKNTYVLENAIGKIAKAVSKANFTSTNGSDKVVQLLNNPNKDQSTVEFLKEFTTFIKASGWVLVAKRWGSFGVTETLELINLNPDDTDFSDDKKTIITVIDGKEEKFAKRDCIPFYDSIRLESGKGYSKITPLRQQVTNAISGGIAKGIQIDNSGTTIVSPKASPNGTSGGIGDSLEAAQITHTNSEGGVIPSQKDVIEAKLNNRGIENRIIVASRGLDAKNLSAELNSFDFNETIEPDILAIYDAFGIPVELTPYGKNATYENKAVAELSLLENEAIPLVDSLVKSLNQEFKGKAVADFNHVDAMSIVHKRNQEANGTTITQMIELLTNEVIDVAKVQEVLIEKGILK